jgi:hypothetical protein
VQPRSVAGGVDEHVSAVAGVAHAESLDPMIDDHPGQTHGRDSAQPRSHGFPYRLEVEVGLPAVDGETGDRAMLGEDAVEQGGCSGLVGRLEHLTQLRAKVMNPVEVRIAGRGQ